jgi:hypothetical protein
MKQPLMATAPAQAEALYDAALENENSSGQIRPMNVQKLSDDWDDSEASDSEAHWSTSFRTAAFSAPKAMFQPQR